MVAVLWNQMIGIAAVLARQSFNERAKFCPRHRSCAHPYRPSVDIARAAFWFHFKYPTCWEIMCSETIFEAVNCSFPLTIKQWVQAHNSVQATKCSARKTDTVLFQFTCRLPISCFCFFTTNVQFLLASKVLFHTYVWAKHNHLSQL
jgi:hypothetical protein